MYKYIMLVLMSACVFAQAYPTPIPTVPDTTSLKGMYGGDGTILYLQGYSTADTSGGGWFITRTSSGTTGTNYFDHPSDGRQWVRQEVDALEQGFVADTTELKALEIGEGKTAYLKQLSSANTLGGGWFAVIDSISWEKGDNDFFNHPTGALQWARVPIQGQAYGTDIHDTIYVQDSKTLYHSGWISHDSVQVIRNEYDRKIADAVQQVKDLIQARGYGLKFTANDTDQVRVKTYVDSAWTIQDDDVVIFIRFKLTDVENNINFMGAYGLSGGANNRWYMSYIGTGVTEKEFRFAAKNTGDNDFLMTSTIQFIDTDWHSLIVYYVNADTTASKFFLDGVAQTTTAGSGFGVSYDDSATFSIGVSPVGSPANQDWSVSKVAIWRGTSLTFTEAMAERLHQGNSDFLDFTTNNGAYNISDSLRALYLFNEGTGQTVADEVGGMTLQLGDTNIVDDKDPTWVEDNPDQPITFSYYDNQMADIYRDTTGYRQYSYICLSPMRKDVKRNKTRRNASNLIKWSEKIVFASWEEGPHTPNTITEHGIGLARSFDGGFTWDSLEVACFNGREPDWDTDSLSFKHPTFVKTDDRVLLGFLYTFKANGPGTNDWDYHKTYLTKSTDLGETWSDTVAIWDSTIAAYTQPTTIQRDDTLLIYAYHLDGNSKTGNTTVSVFRFNLITDTIFEVTTIHTDTTTGAYNESVWLEYMPGKIFAYTRVNARNDWPGGFWYGKSIDYGRTFQYAHRDTNGSYPNFPSLYNNTRDSVIYIYGIKKIKSVSYAGDPDSLFIADTLETTWAFNHLGLYTDRYIPLAGSETDTMQMLKEYGSSIISVLGGEYLLYTVNLEFEPYAEPYVVHAKRNIKSGVPDTWENPLYNGIASWPGDYSETLEYKIHWKGARTTQTVYVDWYGADYPRTTDIWGSVEDDYYITFYVNKEVWNKRFKFRLVE